MEPAFACFHAVHLFWLNSTFEGLVYVDKGKPEHLEKNPCNEAKTNNKLNSHNLWHWGGIKPKPHWLEASPLTTAPSLLPRVSLKQTFIKMPRKKE